MGICFATVEQKVKTLDRPNKDSSPGKASVQMCSCLPRLSSCASTGGRVVPRLSVDPEDALSRLEKAMGHLEMSQFVFPLTQKEIYLLYGSWELVKKDFIGTGVRMFSRMFEVSPEVKDSFDKFRSLGEDQNETTASRVLETHGMVVMFAVDEIINCIDDPDSAIELLIEQGKSHARFGDLREEIFWAIEQPFLYAIKQALGFKFNEQLNEIYAKTIHFILTVIVSGFRQSQLAKARRSVSDTLFASVSGSLPLAVTALTGRPSRHNKIQNDKGNGQLPSGDKDKMTESSCCKEVELIDLETIPESNHSDI